jgi:hypothetical protein
MDNLLKTFFEALNPQNPTTRDLVIHLATMDATKKTQPIEDYEVEYEEIKTDTEQSDEVPLGI